MLTLYIICLCFALVIATLNILNVFNIHFADANVDLDTSLDMGTSLDMDTSASIDGLEEHKERNGFLYVVTFILRLSFYFSIGFGCVGVIATLFHLQPLMVFSVSVVTGILAFFLAKIIMKFLGTTIGEAINDKKLIGLEAKVVIPIYHDQIGQISVNYSDHTYTRYAKLTKQKQNIDIQKDTIVKILAINLDNELIVDIV